MYEYSSWPESSPSSVSVLMRSTKSRPSDCSTPSLFLLMNCLESWQQEAHNSFTVTFRCHFIKIIFILIYRKLSSALQECRFKVPSIKLPPPLLTSSENAQRSAYWYSSYFAMAASTPSVKNDSVTYDLCCSARQPSQWLWFSVSCHIQPKNLLDTHFEDKITGSMF